MHIVFVIDPLALDGLGATLTSLTRNCTATDRLTLHFICHHIRTRHKNNILMLLQTEGFHGQTRFYDFGAQQLPGDAMPLQGSRRAYGKFLIPKLIDADYALYLEPNLLILVDVLSLEDVRFDMEDRFYHIWTPDRQPSQFRNKTIFQFAGFPKPWEVMGKQLHPGYALWATYDTTFWDRRYKRITMTTLYNLWKHRGLLIRYFLQKLRSRKPVASVQARRV